jgi:hypothetical protein
MDDEAVRRTCSAGRIRAQNGGDLTPAMARVSMNNPGCGQSPLRGSGAATAVPAIVRVDATPSSAPPHHHGHDVQRRWSGTEVVTTAVCWLFGEKKIK